MLNIPQFELFPLISWSWKNPISNKRKAETNEIHISVTFFIHETHSFRQEGFRFGFTSDHILSGFQADGHTSVLPKQLTASRTLQSGLMLFCLKSCQTKESYTNINFLDKSEDTWLYVYCIVYTVHLYIFSIYFFCNHRH